MCWQTWKMTLTFRASSSCKLCTTVEAKSSFLDSLTASLRSAVTDLSSMKWRRSARLAGDAPDPADEDVFSEELLEMISLARWSATGRHIIWTRSRFWIVIRTRSSR